MPALVSASELKQAIEIPIFEEFFNRLLHILTRDSGYDDHDGLG